jgi:glycosyltransferase involved in cell wall biosynthesis
MHGELDIQAILRIRAIIKKQKITIVHAHTAHAHGLAALAAFGLPVKLIVTRRVQIPIKKNLLSQWKYRRCDMIVAISECVKSTLISDGLREERIKRIYSGVDLTRFESVQKNSDTRKSLEFSSDGILIGVIAALTHEKDHKTLLQAMQQVTQKNPQAKLLIVGKGVLEDELKSLATSLSIDKNIIFAGFHNDIGAILSTLDIFVLPSLHEGLGTSVLDAMLMSLPVVATNVGGIPEMIEDGCNGFLVPPKDSQMLANRLCQLIENAEMRERFGKEGRKKVEMFDVRKTVQEMTLMYQSINNA